MSGPEHFYPKRKKCKKCEERFGPVVILGLYCSYPCAGLRAPSLNPADWPRTHWYPWRVGGSVIRRAKVPFNSEAEARALLTPVVAYRCTYCYTWHRATPSSRDTKPVVSS